MGNLNENEQWEETVYQLETSDPVLGGPEGISNKASGQLANRTRFLKKKQEETSQALSEHIKSRNHPDATLNNKGFVQLSSATDSTSEELAATPKAVKAAVAAGTAANENAGTRLLKASNLADVPDKARARKNLGLGDIATHDAEEFVPVTRTVNNKKLDGDISLAAADVGAVPTAGGEVAWLDNADHYSTKEGAWPGGGAFQSQLADRRALFYSAGYSASGNVYLPMTKATVQTTGTGYQAAISYGVLVSGKNDFPSGCIHILDDQGRDHIWMFNPNDNSFTANGSIHAGASVYAGGAIFEPGGNINGEIWGGWLSTWLANQFTARDNNINTRATWDWANGQLAARDDNINTRSTWQWVNQRIDEVQSWTLQNFVSSVQLGAVISTWWPAAGGDAPAGYVLTGGDFNDNQSYVRYKPVQFWTRGGWVNAQG